MLCREKKKKIKAVEANKQASKQARQRAGSMWEPAEAL